VIIALMVFSIVVSCGGKASNGTNNTCTENTPKPKWIGSSKADDPQKIRVTSYGEADNIAGAEEIAQMDIYTKLSQRIVARISADSEVVKEVTEKDNESLSSTEQNYKKVFTESIKVGTESILENVNMETWCENFTQGNKQLVRIHKLCDYSKKDLENAKLKYQNFLSDKVKNAMNTFKDAMIAKKKNNISLCLQGLQDANLYAEGTSFERISIEDNDYPDIKSNQLLHAEIKNQLQQITKSMKMINLSDNNLEGKVGDKLTKPLKIKIVYKTDNGEEKPVAQMPVKFSMTKPNGTLSPDKATDNNGEASCEISKIDFSSDVNEVEVSGYYESLPSEFFNHIKLVLRYKSIGRGLLVAVLEESKDENTGDIKVLHTKKFNSEIISILNSKGLKQIAEKDFGNDRDTFLSMHNDDVDVINKIKDETGASDIISCYVQAYTSGIAHPHPLNKEMKVLFFRTRAEIKFISGKNAQVVYTLTISGEDSKDGEVVRTANITEDTIFLARKKSMDIALDLLKTKFQKEFTLKLLKD